MGAFGFFFAAALVVVGYLEPWWFVVVLAGLYGIRALSQRN